MWHLHVCVCVWVRAHLCMRMLMYVRLYMTSSVYMSVCMFLCVCCGACGQVCACTCHMFKKTYSLYGVLFMKKRSTMEFLVLTHDNDFQITVGNLMFESSDIGYIRYIRSEDPAGASITIIALIIVVVLIIAAFIILIIVMKRKKVCDNQIIDLYHSVCLIFIIL